MTKVCLRHQTPALLPSCTGACWSLIPAERGRRAGGRGRGWGGGVPPSVWKGRTDRRFQTSACSSIGGACCIPPARAWFTTSAQLPLNVTQLRRQPFSGSRRFLESAGPDIDQMASARAHVRSPLLLVGLASLSLFWLKLFQARCFCLKF